MSNRAAILTTKDLRVGYRKHPIVSGVDLAVVPGRITTLIGPNGSGKSTLLKTLTLQLPPLSGSIFLRGMRLQDVNARKRSQTIAVLMTERSRPELINCYDVVSAGRYPYTGSLGILSASDREEVTAAMELVGVSPLAQSDFTYVSDGQRQLVLLA